MNQVGGENFLPKYISKLNEYIRLFRRVGSWGEGGESVYKSSHGNMIHAYINMLNFLILAPELKHLRVLKTII